MKPSSETVSLAARPVLQAFIETELLPQLEMDPVEFWRGVERIIADLTPENRRLLDVRAQLQARLDAFHGHCTASNWDARAYRALLEEIGYLRPSGPAFTIDTDHVDPEIARVAGPQLVVPVSNARFALNAANARWGSLYDAFYGTDVVPSSEGLEPGKTYNPQRGAAVISRAADFLDRAFPLVSGAHQAVVEYCLDPAGPGTRLRMVLQDGAEVTLRDPDQYVGHRQEGGRQVLLLRNHGLHAELHIDRDHPVGRDSTSGLCDIQLESAVTTIQDCEDSVAAVDADDKVAVYRNWLGLMQGTLEASFEKGGKTLQRALNPDRDYTTASGGSMTLPGRSLMLVRNVGHLMTTDALLDANGREVFEGILDAIVTVGCGLVDLRGLGRYRNSRAGSIYIVKPKMHGPDEVAFADRLFAAVEDLYGLDRYTLKIGVMDEERRTTVNLPECIRAVQHRIVFINTGFLDRTGDEIHTSMVAGPMLPKEQIKQQRWILAYEDWNVDVGIRCGLPGRAQIGKGMWPKPDEMREMVQTKAMHPRAGANCAWVPSPTAATLHALHYHEVDVAARQQALAEREMASIDDILTPPFCTPEALSPEVIQSELDNNAQGILGYVVRWIDQGVGCSKVPDINDVGLMEDRATLRISSQHMANWLYHGICSEEQVMDTFRRMAVVVDQQNAGDPAYRPMAPEFGQSVAFQAACALALEGTRQPSGYTEPLLHTYRRKRKELD
jgi:malate synthase